MSRIILFAKDFDRLGSFYGDVPGIARFESAEAGWSEFDAGSCRIALHKGGRDEKAPRSPKLVFHCADVATMREKLNTVAPVSAR